MSVDVQTTKDLLARLIAFDTTSANSNLPLIDFVREYLAGYSIESTLVPDDTGQKAALFATIGPADRPGIGLSGHTDVVPVAGQSWASDPFRLTADGPRLYGRGSTDMKGFLACILATVPRFASTQLTTPVHLLFSYDEEVGCIGVRPMIGELGRTLPLPRLIIVGEPTEMAVVDAHKSINAFRTEVTGHEAHSSMTHHGANAIIAASQLICELARIRAELREAGGANRFDPPFTTVQVGVIEGGTALNIVPKSCRFSWEYRGLPGQDIQSIPDRLDAFAEAEVLPAMRAVSPEVAIVTERWLHVPSYSAVADSPAVSVALQLAEQNKRLAVSYGTEAGLFEAAGTPTVVCGPGSIDQAHKPNEFVMESELSKCLKFLERLADHAAAA